MTDVSIIVAGSGKTNADEVSDLLGDWLEPYEAINLYFPVDTVGFSPAVQQVASWTEEGEHDNLIPFLPTETKKSQKSRKANYDPVRSECETLSELLAFVDHREEETYLLVALPNPEEDPDGYDSVVDLIMTAADTDIPVKDLTAGLDDVVFETEGADETPAEPKPVEEPESEKPKRKSRAKPAQETPTGDVLQEEIAVRKQSAGRVDRILVALRDVREALSTVEGALEQLSKDELEAADAAETPEEPAEVPEPPKEAERAAEAPTEAPKRGRGRPRLNAPTEKQIWDELADDQETDNPGAWVSRPRGRVAKGTQTRTINKETGEILEEGEV